jgi:hypothetical protein
MIVPLAFQIQREPMKKPIVCLICLLSFVFAFGQGKRDAVKIGGGYNLLTIEDAFVPNFYVEYSRIFYEPVSLGIVMGYSKATGIETLTENRDLETLHFDFAVYYSFSKEEDVHQIRPGFMLSARSYKTDWENISDGNSGTDRFFKPGLGFILNYDAHIGELFVVGLKGSLAAYDKENTVYTIGGHVGIRF